MDWQRVLSFGRGQHRLLPPIDVPWSDMEFHGDTAYGHVCKPYLEIVLALRELPDPASPPLEPGQMVQWVEDGRLYSARIITVDEDHVCVSPPQARPLRPGAAPPGMLRRPRQHQWTGDARTGKEPGRGR